MSIEDNTNNNDRYKAWELCSVNMISMSTAILPGVNDIENDKQEQRLHS